MINEIAKDPSSRWLQWEAGIEEGIKAEDGWAETACFYHHHHHHHCLRLYSCSSCQRLLVAMATVGLCCKLKAEPLKLGTKHQSSTNRKATGEGAETKDYPGTRAPIPIAKRTILK